MRTVSFRLLLALLAVVVCGACTKAPDPSGPATIVLVTVDGLRAPQVGALGGSTPTPALQRLVADGVVYRDLWTVTPLTRPAVTTYLTGLTPPQHGVRDGSSTSLAAGTPTLATLLGAAGFSTAAFPDSSVLGFDSGLLDGFEMVDPPPVPPVGPLTWLPLQDVDRQTARSVGAWLDGLAADAPAFAWVHLSHALMEQLIPDDAERRPDLAALDAQIGGVLDALRVAGRYDDAWVVIAPTAGDIRGSEADVAGPGLSLGAAAISVPLFVKPPRGVELAADGAPWAPDVATTLAAAASTALPSPAGIDLRAAAPSPTRVRLAWSGAPRDQLGWRPLVAASVGRAMTIDGMSSRPVRRVLDGTAAAPADDDAVWDRLDQALAGAGMPAAPRVPLDEVRELLEKHGVTIDPVAAAGRSFDDAQARGRVGREWFAGRVALLWGAAEEGLAALGRALETDPDALGVRICLSQLPALSGQSARAMELIGPAAGRYPDHPDVLHWTAHALWSASVPDGAALLTAIEPFKPYEGDVLYDLACARSIAGDLAESEAYLRRAIEAGYRFWESMAGDPDLRALRKSGRFAAVMREYRR